MKLIFKTILAFCLFLNAFQGISQGTEPTKGITILSYNHVGLAVKDLKTSVTFYREIIGLSPLDVPDNLLAIRRWFKVAPGQELHLLLGRENPVANNDKNAAHFSLSIPTNSADGIEAFLKEKNVPYHRQKRFDGAFQIYVTDPDGYVIELNEPKK
ncbi:VOC family protein [Arcicella sp. LKC2W]|uniref:VOC family protein n=1 Tax=Arcicella sp. LKC2W TaxID=2984198 RepID=UPI002B213A13|nr:VOC family protein [Arcicella sp. LKC2W]MEA5460750.1 VOC family protein [Arcicella sp. LKC2W]